MIKYWVFLVGLLSLASPAMAQNVPVRSGEHEGYTRLVAQVPANTEWRIQHTKNGARLRVAIDGVTFETGSVFKRLTQNRLVSVSQKEPGAALELEFGCDCVAKPFIYKDTMIVVDIAPGPRPLPLHEDIPPLALPKAPKQDALQAIPHSLSTVPLPLMTLNAHQIDDQLSTRILQGSDRGILGLSLTQIGPRASALVDTVSIPADLVTNINVTSIMDELDGLLGPDILQLEPEPACINNRELGFETWSDERSFHEQVATLRMSLFQEFDHVDSKVAMKLAKLYAYYGFGAESEKLLELLGQSTPETARISAINGVLDGDFSFDPNPFADLQRCEGYAALWAVLTENTLAQDVNLDAVEQSFARLPDHLRRAVGPLLSETLTRANKLEAARRVTRALGRVETQPSVDTTKAKAAIAEAEGNEPKAKAFLTEVATAPEATLDAPLALARLIEKRWSERSSVSTQEAELLAAYSIEFRRSEITSTLMRAQAVAYSLGQEFDQALDMVSQIPSESERDAALNKVTIILAERADDTTFLRRILSLPDKNSQALDTKTALVVADRLAALGFATPAFALTNRAGDTRHQSERALLRARTVMMTGRPHQALLEIGEDTSEDAMEIKRQALETTGALQAAAELTRDAGNADAANRLFWLADLPEEVDPSEAGKYGQITEDSEKLKNPPPRAQDKPLADAANLLQDSQEARQRIRGILTSLN